MKGTHNSLAREALLEVALLPPPRPILQIFLGLTYKRKLGNLFALVIMGDFL